MRFNLEQQIRCFFEIFRIFGFRIKAKIVHCRWDDFGWSIQHGDTAISQFGDVCFVKDQCPAISWRSISKTLFHLFLIVANAGCSPHVNNGVFIAWIKLSHIVHDCAIHVFDVWQLGLVKLLENTGLNLPRHE